MTEPESFKAPIKPSASNVDCALNTDGNTYLHELCLRDAPLDLIREAVLDLGANANAVNKKNMPPLGLAIMHARPEVVRELVHLGCRLYLDLTAETQFNALLLAVYHGKKDILDEVIALGGALYMNKSGVNVDGKQEGFHCLHAAIAKRQHHMIEALVDAGAYLDTPAGPSRHTPLQLAATEGDVAPIQILLRRGAALEYTDSGTGMRPLHCAVLGDRMQAVQELLANGADMDAKTDLSLTPLMISAANGNVGITRLLVEKGADVNARQTNMHGDTALMKGAKKGSTDVVSALLDGGADATLTDAFNKTAAAHARTANNSVIAERLDAIEADAQQNSFEKAYNRYRP